ncbi:MAG TPA: DNA recombination protein RmuC [Mycobacteriales bacterium]|nr:DNA recombination protein RmuC [Mycobacteriales bacterium]
MDALPLALALLAALAGGLVLGLAAGRLLARRDEQLLLSSFQGLASRALAGTREEAARELDGQRDAVAHLVHPLAEQLSRVDAHLRELEVERARTSAELREQVSTVRLTSESLGRETAALVDALRKPQARGRWGEVQLRRVVEHAGMTERCDFDEQVSVVGADGRALRPDLVVRLAGGRCVVVDAKVTLAAYLEAVESGDERVREERLDAHARHLRAHVDRLADKAYWSQLGDTPEFVVLFVPGEAFLAPALERDPALLEHAFSRRVHLATPTTLISMLRTVAYAWQQQALTENARAVFETGKELHARLATLGGHVDKLGRTLGTAVADYNRTVGSLERTVLPASRRMADLGVVEQALPLPREVDDVAKPISAPHLLDAPGPGQALVAVPDEATG